MRTLLRRPNFTFTWPKILQPFRIFRQDARNFRSRYISDWNYFNQQILASAVYMFFTNLLPGVVFASDFHALTGANWGTIEVVLSTGLVGVIFSLLSCQPLTILGVTGTFAILAENIYTLCVEDFHIDFLQFMGWAFIHSAWMHMLLATFNAHDYTMRYVTTFSTEVFSLLNSIIYFHKAIQELQRTELRLTFAGFLYAIIGAIGTCLVAIFFSTAERWAPLFHKYFRIGVAEYAAAMSVILFIGMPHVGRLANLDQDLLPVPSGFYPTKPGRTTFYIPLGDLPVSWIFGAMLPGFIITVLYFFDHEVSSIICTTGRYNAKKPGGYAWDIMLLGFTTMVCGIMGIPPSNGLLPQAPLHSESLLHNEKVEVQVYDDDGLERTEVKVERTVYEQRWSHFLHAGAIFIFVSPPLMVVLGLTPTSVLAGLFLFMGEQSLSVNPVLYRFFYMLTPPSELPALPDHVPGWLGVHMYTLTQIVVTAIVFGITLTTAGPAFPILVIILVPIRLLLMNKIWNRETLRYVDKWACKPGTPEDEADEKMQDPPSESSNGAVVEAKSD